MFTDDTITLAAVSGLHFPHGTPDPKQLVITAVAKHGPWKLSMDKSHEAALTDGSLFAMSEDSGKPGFFIKGTMSELFICNATPQGEPTHHTGPKYIEGHWLAGTISADAAAVPKGGNHVASGISRALRTAGVVNPSVRQKMTPNGVMTNRIHVKLEKVETDEDGWAALRGPISYQLKGRLEPRVTRTHHTPPLQGPQVEYHCNVDRVAKSPLLNPRPGESFDLKITAISPNVCALADRKKCCYRPVGTDCRMSGCNSRERRKPQAYDFKSKAEKTEEWQQKVAASAAASETARGKPADEDLEEAVDPVATPQASVAATEPAPQMSPATVASIERTPKGEKKPAQRQTGAIHVK